MLLTNCTRVITKLLLIICCLLLLAPSLFAQVSFESWQEEAKTNKRLLPRYGDLPKTKEELEADKAFIDEITAKPQFRARRDASNHMIKLGFEYYYRGDFKTAMYRFNQAYLLDATNTDIFWGYGAIYMALGQHKLARDQYRAGLSINPDNPRLLTDLATYFMAQYYITMQATGDSKTSGKSLMDSSIHYLKKSYALDAKDANTTFKLSICYWNMEDCKNAWKYYDLTAALGGEPITEAYTKDLKERCKVH
jgi:tetratricopeptide (TPR) repeat protein